ncbi:hypothetical protein [Dokdonella sp.]|uniref:DUF6970 domain-containing protein n=1 Tax=Dokdonella sp. TaxID=2291710 RepID=UPI0026094227|nr:hypothetical protein [Dokdonella sp.]
MRPILAVVLLVSASCAVAAPPQSQAPSVVAPPFVAALIERARAAPPTNPPTSVVRYTYLGRTVYYVPPRCCDVPGALYDADGARLCEPDGGFAGSGDGKCPDFLERRRDESLVWKDER